MPSSSSRFTLSAQGQSQTQDCAFHAGTIWSAPIKVSYFLVILYIYSLIESIRLRYLPIWCVFCSVTLKQLVLIATILCHEFGHGKMATYLGGSIQHILLWPFGGICFSRRPAQEFDNRTKLFNELKVVCAGPLTHFLQAPFWLAVFIGVRQVIPHADFGSASWEYLIPFYDPIVPQWCPVKYDYNPQCISSLGQWMLFDVVRFALVMNVMLFMFNVFFPMYPLDGSKIMACTLMLCGLSAVTAAKILIFTSVPLIGYLLFSAFSSAQVRGGVGAGITVYLGFMCLMETYRIYDLLKKRQLHLHPLFETARSSTYAATDDTYRLNTSTRDDVARNEAYRPVSVPSSFQAFSTEGRKLDAPTDKNENGRGTFLDRLEQNQARNNLTVRELQEQHRNRNETDDDAAV